MKAGDRVRATARAPLGYKVPQGAVGTLIEVDEFLPFGYSVKWDKIKSEHGVRIWLMAADEIEELPNA